MLKAPLVVFWLDAVQIQRLHGFTLCWRRPFWVVLRKIGHRDSSFGKWLISPAMSKTFE
jgi:hypothetical protein